jgi:hypothetical protein
VKILTIDEAFNDSNFVKLHNVLLELNVKGISDPNFLTLVQSHIDSRDSAANFNFLKFERVFGNA